MRLDEVSNDGQSLLYDVTSPEQQTTYSTFSVRAGSHNLIPGAHLAGNASGWMQIISGTEQEERSPED